jgi:aspartyl-tRNA synthetase
MGNEAYRTIHAAEVRPDQADRVVRVAGWAERIRDQGGVIFVDLRDATGVVQVVFRPTEAGDAMGVAQDLKRESCVQVEGVVRRRPEGMTNPELASGEMEIEASSAGVLSRADTLPFQLDGRVEVAEERRLRHRYLDLRTPRMASNLRARSAVIRAMRRVLDERGFLDVETPTLIASTPEGARDFLVPSRLRPGNFYALPQSPQLFKQLLMIGGVERYYQIARCYRDEDFRSDRQVEFSQLDLEGAFWGQDDVLETLEAVVTEVVRDLRGVELDHPIPRMTYADAMRRYGTDKPDLRFDMEIVDVSHLFGESEFKAFAGVVADGGVVRAINAGEQGLARAGLDSLVARAQDLGAKGLVWMVVEQDGTLRSPVAKFLSDDEREGIRAATDAAPGDVLLLVGDRERVVAPVLGQLRLDLGQPDDHNELAFLFVVDFPVFEVTPEGQLVPAHHPFTAPVSVDEMRTNPETAISKAYDMVLNGSELGSGSVRIHDSDVQAQVFEVLGISAEQAQRRFGWFMDALRYGTPPHAGFAIGIDRLVAILQNESNIREVIPFPKTQTGADPLTGSPGRVEEAQLQDLGITIRPEVEAAWSTEDEASPDA